MPKSKTKKTKSIFDKDNQVILKKRQLTGVKSSINKVLAKVDIDRKTLKEIEGFLEGEAASDLSGLTLDNLHTLNKIENNKKINTLTSVLTKSQEIRTRNINNQNSLNELCYKEEQMKIEILQAKIDCMLRTLETPIV